MGRTLSYSKKIKENTTALKKLEKAQKEILFRERVRFIRVLKTGEAKTQKEAERGRI